MSEMVEVFRALKEIDKQERWDSQKANLALLKGAGFLKKGKLNGEHTLVIRSDRGAKVDFYLTRNKWWDHNKRRCRYGDAIAFIHWYLAKRVGTEQEARFELLKRRPRNRVALSVSSSDLF